MRCTVELPDSPALPCQAGCSPRRPAAAAAVASLLGWWAVASASAGPQVFWASDPVGPGETVVAIGEGFGDRPTVQIARLADSSDGEPAAIRWPSGTIDAEAIQCSARSVKFAIPSSAEGGVYVYRIAGEGGHAMGLLNAPTVYWAQGDQGTAASPGGSIRLFGRCLGRPAATPVLRLESQGGVARRIAAAKGTAWEARFELPADLPAGRYTLQFHSGRGDAGAWAAAGGLEIKPRAAWPDALFNVREFGAEGDGVKDDTQAVLAALARAEREGGGTVYFPRGRYRLAEALEVPRFTVLRGERREWTCLAWTDFEQPPEALVRGTNSFGLADLTLYARNHRHVIVGDLGSQPDAGDVFLRRLLVRADLYRGHLKLDEVDQRFRAAMKLSTGGGDTVRLGGRNIEIAQSDFYGSGRVLFLSRVRGGRVAGNKLYNGRWGWYCISGSDGLVFEDNEITGGDLMSTGGGLNCLDGSAYSQNVLMAGNRFSLMHGWDREAMTSDAGGEAYFGAVAAVQGATVTLAAEPQWPKRDYTGAALFVLDGKGAGQYRRVVRYEGARVELDRPWAVEPDAASQVGITMFQGRYIVLDNSFTDTGAMQFYGTSVECLAVGNRGTRMQGFRGLGLHYHGYQPSWFCQFLDNQILEGNYYHWMSAAEAFLDVQGARRPPCTGPLNVGSIVRRNHLHNNAHLRVTGTCRDALVEGNVVENAAQGVFISRDTSGVLARDNRFRNVGLELVDEVALRQAAQERLRRYLGRREPVAHWDFESRTARHFADASGNGFAASAAGAEAVPGGVRGLALRLDGTQFLRVEEPAVFNAPDITVALWVQPATLAGRRGLISKRFAGTAAPWVLSQVGAGVSFEAAEENGPWSFNFHAPPRLEIGRWTHVAAVAQQGQGVTLFIDGQPVARKENPAARQANQEPVILGREAWGGDPPKGNTPGWFVGLIDEVKIWTRALAADEIAAEFASVGPQAGKAKR